MTCQGTRRVTRRPCRYGCGHDVDVFRDDLGFNRQIDTTPIPITTDLKSLEVRLRLWENRGRNLGWTLKDIPVRTWRELRLEHECANTPENQKKSKYTTRRSTK